MEKTQTQLVINKHGPVIIIENCPGCQESLAVIFKKLDCRNKILFFLDAEQALEYINTTHDLPFLILSDIRMPLWNGSIRQSMDELEKTLGVFVKYWPRCAAPNAYCV